MTKSVKSIEELLQITTQFSELAAKSNIKSDRSKATRLLRQVDADLTDNVLIAERTFIASALAHRVLTAKEERVLTTAYHEEVLKNGHDSPYATRIRHALSLYNLRLVASISHNYRDRGLSVGELLNEGYIGLDHAIRLFDVTREFRLTTYVYNWIDQCIQRAVQNTGSLLRLPAHIIANLQSLHKKRAQANSALLRYLYEHPEAANDIDSLHHEHYLALKQDLEQATEEIGKLQTQLGFHTNQYCAPSVNPLLIDSETEDGEAGVWEGSLMSDEDLEASAVQSQAQRLLYAAVAQLPYNEQVAIKHRYGLAGVEEKTLQQIGEILGYSRESVRKFVNQGRQRLSEMLPFQLEQDEYSAD